MNPERYLEEPVERFCAGCESLRDENAELKAALEEAHRDIDSGIADLKFTEARNEELFLQIIELKTELGKAIGEISEGIADLKFTEAENEKLRLRISALRNNLTVIRNELQNYSYTDNIAVVQNFLIKPLIEKIRKILEA